MRLCSQHRCWLRALVCCGMSGCMTRWPSETARACLGAQLQGWCQAMCLNRARQRRRHRRAIEDWAYLQEHARNADISPDFAAWLPRSGWAWQAHPDAPVRFDNPIAMAYGAIVEKG